MAQYDRSITAVTVRGSRGRVRCHSTWNYSRWKKAGFHLSQWQKTALIPNLPNIIKFSVFTYNVYIHSISSTSTKSCCFQSLAILISVKLLEK